MTGETYLIQESNLLPKKIKINNLLSEIVSGYESAVFRNYGSGFRNFETDKVIKTVHLCLITFDRDGFYFCFIPYNMPCLFTQSYY